MTKQLEIYAAILIIIIIALFLLIGIGKRCNRKVEKKLQNATEKLVLERRKRMKLEDKLMRVKAMIKMYSAIDREVANTIVESIDETVEEVNK